MQKTKNSFSVKRTFVFPDTHFQAPLDNGKGFLSPEHCHHPEALSVALQAFIDFGADQVIHLGDIAEMGTVSRWSKMINKEGLVQGKDRRWYEAAWKPQMDMVTTFWEFIKKVSPKSEKFQLEGNHDYWAAAHFSRQPLCQFEEMSFRNLPIWEEIDFRKYDPVIDEKPPYVIVGDASSPHRAVKILHGYGKTIERMRKEHTNIMCGDSHQIDYAKWTANSWGGSYGQSIGCLCQLAPDFSSRGGRQNGWEHGFGTIYTSDDGFFQMEAHRIQKGRLLNFIGKSYEAKPLSDIDRALKILELP